MKSIRNVLVLLFVLGGFATLPGLLHAQETAPPSADEDVSGLSDLEVELRAIEMTPPAPAAELPQAGTFWSAQHAPGSPEAWPPLPSAFGMAAWPLGDDGVFLLDDLAKNYDAPVQTGLKARGGMGAMDASGPGDGDDSGGGAAPDFSPPPADYGTNLWLAQVALTNGYLTAIASNTLAGVLYEMQTNAALTATNWGTFASFPFFYGSEETNWTSLAAIGIDRNTTNLFFRLRSWADDGSGLPIWWQLEHFGYTGVDPYDDPDEDGWNNLQEFQNGTDPHSFNTPPTPQGLTVAYNASSATATVSWLPSPSPVSTYTVKDSAGNTFNFDSSVHSFSTNVPNVPNRYVYEGDPTVNRTFQVQANYTHGSSALSSPIPLEPDTLSASLITGRSNVVYLAASGIPANTVTLYLRLGNPSYNLVGDTSHDDVHKISISAVTNGLFQLPTSWALPGSGQAFWLQSSNANGSLSAGAWVADNWFNTGALPPPFFDGRVQLKQNLIFQFRIADTVVPFGFIAYTNNFSVDFHQKSAVNNPVDYAYAGFYDINNGNLMYGTVYDEPILNVYLPFEDNIFYQNFVFNSSNADANGNMITGAEGYTPNGTFVGDGTNILLQLTPAYLPSTNSINFSPALGTNQTRWLCVFPMAFPDYSDLEAYYAYDESSDTFFGINNFSLQTTEPAIWAFETNKSNYWGLPYVSAKTFYSVDGINTLNTILNPGNSVTTDYPQASYVETAQPQFQTVEYDFWESDPYGNLPILPGSHAFSMANKSDLMIVGLGGNIPTIAGYAKLAVLNGYSGVYGYLGQYFDQAYQIDTNGVVTTNTTGVLSPYGSFFATEPGPAALVTMPDIDTGERGTATVYCVSLQLDKNHDGIMDGSFNGPDATSQASPMVCWVNNGCTVAGTGGALDQDLPLPLNHPEYANGLQGKVTCQRDLENFFRLWICGLPLALSNQNYSASLTCNAISGSPAINLYFAETNGGTGYLTDTNVAGDLVEQSKLATISPTSPYFSPLSEQDGSPLHFLFEGAGIGEGQFVLTIYQGANAIAQTSIFIDLHDVKDLYEQAHITGVPTTYPEMVQQTNASTFVSDHALPVNSAETNQLIVFVHGWRMGVWDYQSFSDTMFKRLYWSGYQGRFAALRWPTLSADDYRVLGDLQSYTTYNRSEYMAHRSADGTSAYFDWLKSRLPDYSINVAAHSMGNILMMEALKDQLAEGHSVIDNYVMMQAAVPAQCYDPSLADYSLFTAAEATSHTPDIYRGFPGNIAAAVNGNIVNFFNTNDFALATGTEPIIGSVSWEHNEVSYKPDGYWDYSSDGTSCFIDVGFLNYRTVTNPYEQMAFVARPRSKAAGALPNVGGVVLTTRQVDLTGQFHFRTDSSEHSAEFNWPIQQLGGMTNGFYPVLLHNLFP